MSGKIADFSNFQKLNSEIILAQFLYPKILVAKIEQDIFLHSSEIRGLCLIK